jgi:hypothetical protein
MTSSPVPKTRSDFRNDVTKIESQMLEAIKELKDWRRQNTRVEIIDFPGVEKRANVYLYSKCVCKLTEDEIEINHRGFMTSTTKSRLNALLNEFNGSVQIVQIKGVWYLKMKHPLKDFSFSWKVIPSHAQPFTFKRI